MSDVKHAPPEVGAQAGSAHHGHAETEEFAGGYISAYHGSIPWWLMAVYFILFVWGLYYMFDYWGGLGPGLDY